MLREVITFDRKAVPRQIVSIVVIVLLWRLYGPGYVGAFIAGTIVWSAHL